jgi:hypothetical protein
MVLATPTVAEPLRSRSGFRSAESVAFAASMLTKAHRWDGCEGPRSQLVIAPGVFTVQRRDPARGERSEDRARSASRTAADQMAVGLLADDLDAWTTSSTSTRRITAWSRKSRANMIKALASLDYTPMLTGARSAMVTLTYPGEWESVAPDGPTCYEQLKTLRRRFERHYKVKMLATWKREFQRRGAPHFHLFMVPPEPVNGESFRDWLARSWADVVGHADPVQRERHRMVGTAVDYSEGARATDPVRLAVYFSKHGSYSAKDYQNDAPAPWLAAGVSVGRFWGVWGLPKATATVEVTPTEALAAARVTRRWARANGYSQPRSVWRSSTAAAVDPLTGERPVRWRRRRVTRPVKRMRGDAGFVTINDAPAFVFQLAGYLDQVHLHATGEIRDPRLSRGGVPAAQSGRGRYFAR